ncbi:NAD(P)/FAD-dependent oxidoreductase [Pseudooceanicola sp. HF7]|uniref:NAD(P)/FAD-dependent oxidoreductase n=1 Tax=Pseudooceanicola sp. HF7 TaxID=2721560 RepID=UPI00142FE02A|nr:NAD(P)/FAD-dependent oxidoreductase [Pseudooceanicola sp. HF7]NIZ11730.1 NAD(P)/FAD-dependent oxidoreductase [Pseudooceanicola sp. HF7]
MAHDVIVVGGGYAGMAAALQLVRARRKVLLIDGGERRNRFASRSHGFLTQDGMDPAAIAATAQAQLAAYPKLTWEDGAVVDVTGHRDAFRVLTQDGAAYAGRRILFAVGVTDILPDIPGLRERWGHSVFHCPYCHGYELDQGRIGVIASGKMSVHQAELLTEWGAVTFLTNKRVTLDAAARAALTAKAVKIEETPIQAIEGHAEVRLTDDRSLPFAGLLTASRVEPASDVPEKTGCVVIDTPMGRMIRTDEVKLTSIPGIYACGDVASMPHSVSLAVGDGAMAGMQLHRSLVWPDG